MFIKLLTALIMAVVIGATVFHIRQQRLELMHEITVLHRQMNRDRQETWDVQVRIAQQAQPQALREALARVGMPMEPIAVENAPSSESPTGTELVHARHHGDR